MPKRKTSTSPSIQTELDPTFKRLNDEVKRLTKQFQELVNKTRAQIGSLARQPAASVQRMLRSQRQQTKTQKEIQNWLKAQKTNIARQNRRVASVGKPKGIALGVGAGLIGVQALQTTFRLLKDATIDFVSAMNQASQRLTSLTGQRGFSAIFKSDQLETLANFVSGDFRQRNINAEQAGNIVKLQRALRGKVGLAISKEIVKGISRGLKGLSNSELKNFLDQVGDKPIESLVSISSLQNIEVMSQAVRSLQSNTDSLSASMNSYESAIIQVRFQWETFVRNFINSQGPNLEEAIKNISSQLIQAIDTTAQGAESIFSVFGGIMKVVDTTGNFFNDMLKTIGLMNDEAQTAGFLRTVVNLQTDIQELINAGDLRGAKALQQTLATFIKTSEAGVCYS